jgi:LemA protein
MGALLVLVVVGVFFLLALLGVYNGLVSKRIAAENAWSQIDVQLKRRHDLIPNLVETVKGYASHEKDTLQKVVQARNSAVSAAQQGNVKDQIQAENMLTGALRQVFALAEAYPDLKANQNFAQLQEELTSTENRIGFARQHYNDSAATYNTAIEQIPGNIVRGFGNFPHKEFFELSAEEKATAQQAPSVSFS